MVCENPMEICFQYQQWKQQICRLLKENENILSYEVIKSLMQLKKLKIAL